MPDQQSRSGVAAVDDMQLAAFLASHGLPIIRWHSKSDKRHWWAIFELTDEYKRLRLEWIRSPEFMAFQVYNDLMAQIKNTERTPVT